MIIKNERRRATRSVLDAGIVLGYVKNNEKSFSIITGTVHDISSHGIGITANKHCVHDSKISLHLYSLSKAPVFKTSGKVMRCFKKERGEYYIGIEFKDINKKIKSDVEGYIELIQSSQRTARQIFH
jgi:c-di-GMP-binding flagellar brake protein YcgR